MTATGRMIILNPPLQHIPKRFVIQKESIVGLRKMIIARTGKSFFIVSIKNPFSRFSTCVIRLFSIGITRTCSSFE
jgi:hypothetical protein